MTQPPHDEDRFARIYTACKVACVRYAAGLLASTGNRNRHLRAFDAEEFYDTAWETYYRRREYLEDRPDHIAYLNALIESRFRDEQRRSRAQKRTQPGRAVEDRPGTRRGGGGDGSGPDHRVLDRAELEDLLSRVRNPADARALVDHEMGGLTFEEIGAKEGITAEAARRRAQRAAQQARRGRSGGTGDDRT
ncbi:MAG TPA: hypothetical protein VGJ86_21895 [Acidimicrobiales bacterium]|jgi:RNA polymerase sigma factor (sigma-70 family)